MNDYIVYCHTCLINNKKYIGITRQKINRRWRNGYGYRNNKHFFDAITKYGWNSFNHQILFAGLTCKEAKSKEQELISLYQTQNKKYGYNLTGGGESGYSPNEETRLKMRMAKLGTTYKGRKMSNETKNKISIGNKGKIRSEEFKNKLREYNKSCDWSFIKNSKKIKCIETGMIYNSITEASKILGAKNNSNFKRSIDTNTKWLGYHWQYI